jgi:protein phosphatase
MRVAGLTTKGLLRGNNEDNAAVDGRLLHEDELVSLGLDEGAHVLVLADGIGGYAHGEIASKTAVETISILAPQLVDEEACSDCVGLANDVLYSAMRRDPDLRGMGTTIVGMAIRRNRALWFNVGDSRAYLYRAGLKQLTVDHVPAALLPGGQRCHTLTQWLGGFDENEDLWPETGRVVLEPSDKLLLCSDGVTDVLSDDEIAGMLAQDVAPDAIVRRVVDEVMSRGAPDNITLILAGP